MNTVILTPIKLESAILRGLLMNLEIRYNGKFTCEVGQFKGKHHTYQVAIKETGSRETAAALTTQSVVKELNPLLLILLSICDGIKDVKIGDVVVGTNPYVYEAGKETPDGFMARPESYHYDKELTEYIKILLHYSDWKKRSTHSQNTKVVFEPVASCNKVITSTTSSIYQQLKLHYNDTTAIEMEAAGFAKAAFAFEMLYHLEFEEFKLVLMNVKELTKSLMTIFVPLLKLESVNQFKKEYKGNMTHPIPKLWNRVSSMFKEEIEDLKRFPDEEDILEESVSGIRKKLRIALTEDNSFKAEMEDFFQKTEKENIDNLISVTNSKNLITGGTFNINGDFHLGDNN